MKANSGGQPTVIKKGIRTFNFIKNFQANTESKYLFFIDKSSAQKISFNCRLGSKAKVEIVLYGCSETKSISGKFCLEKYGQLSVYIILAKYNDFFVEQKVVLAGDYAEAKLNMVLVGAGDSNGTFYNNILHKSPHAFSRLNIRRLQFNSSESRSQAILKIAKRAVKSDTYLSDKILLVDEDTKASSQPVLEILTNDVKASHSASCGYLSPKEINYLRSRGLDKKQAESLILQGFATELLPQNNIIRDWLNDKIINYARHK
ncbi:MAG: SufD family Fe-S cluster assembly protein [Patescibacteria group bacterium]